MLVNRDPFAREEIHAKRVYNPKESCAWCGNITHTTWGPPYLYAYRVETDGGRTHEIKGLFCNSACRRSYHGG